MHDREPAIKNAIRKGLELLNLNSNQFMFLTHVYQNIKRHVTKRAKAVKKSIDKLIAKKKMKKCDLNISKNLYDLISSEKLIEELSHSEDESEDNKITEDGDLKQKEDELKKLINFRNDFHNKIKPAKDLKSFNDLVDTLSIVTKKKLFILQHSSYRIDLNS